MSAIVSIHSYRGGTGKSNITANIAYQLASAGKRVAVCNTDIEITKGYMGFHGIPGHEFVGVVEETNDSDQGLLGKRVVGEINCACLKSSCEYCKQDLGRHCPDRTTLGIFRRDGCLAEYITLPLVNLIEVPEHIPAAVATLTEPLAADQNIDLSPVVVNEITVVGSRCGLFQQAVDYLATGVDMEPLITAVYPADQAIEAFEHARTKGSLKVLIEFATQ